MVLPRPRHRPKRQETITRFQKNPFRSTSPSDLTPWAALCLPVEHLSYPLQQDVYKLGPFDRFRFLPTAPVAQQVVVELGAGSMIRDRGTGIDCFCAGFYLLEKPLSFLFALHVEHYHPGRFCGIGRAKASFQLPASKKPFLEHLEYLDALLLVVHYGHYLPARECLAQPYLRSSFFELFVEIGNAGNALSVNVFFRIVQRGGAFEADPLCRLALEESPVNVETPHIKRLRASNGTLCTIFASTSHDIVENGPLHFLENQRAVLHSFWYIDNAAIGNNVFLIIQPELHFTA